MNEFWRRLQNLIHRRAFERDLDEEMRFHLDMKARESDNYSARRQFGNVARLKETSREMWGWASLERLVQDLRYALRMMRRSPGFTSVAILSLALGIGANTAIFTLVNALLVKSLPVQDPGMLYLLGGSERNTSYSYPMYKLFRGDGQVFSGLLAVSEGTQRWNVLAGGPNAGIEQVDGSLVSGNYFQVLGVGAVLGRTLTPDDDKLAGAHPVAMISYGYWKRRFALDPSVLGSTIRVNRTPLTVIGVAPQEFFGIEPGNAPDIWAPLMMQEPISGISSLEEPGSWWLHLMGRLKPGIDEAQASARMTLLYQQAIPEQFGSALPQRDMQRMLRMRVNLMPGSKGLSDLRRRFSRPLLILMGVVGLVLLTACANVANLLLAKAAFRRSRNRRAVGARSRASAAGARNYSRRARCSGHGWPAWVAVRARGRGDVAQAGLERAEHRCAECRARCPRSEFYNRHLLVNGDPVRLGSRIAGGAGEYQSGPQGEPHPIGYGIESRQGARIRQVALSLLVLIGAGLFVRSLQNLNSVDVGYNRHNLLLVSIAPTAAGYSGSGVPLLSRRLLDKLAAIPGVDSASLSLNGLFIGGDNQTRFQPEGQKSAESTANVDWVGPNYFSTVGIPILLGREIGTQDNNSSRKVAVVNEALARYAFPGINPVGRRFSTGNPKHPLDSEIAGVTRDVKDHQLQQDPPRRFYVPFFQADPDMFKHSRIRFELRVLASPASIAADARRAVQEIDKNLPILEISPLTVLIDRSLAPERLIASIIGLFSLLALVLAALGLYGIMAYAVARRTNEIGIRMALGAEPGRVLWLVLREALQLVVLGLAIGIPLALAMSRVVRGMLFGLSPNDPRTIAVAAVLMMLVAVLAAYIPARRAAHVDPITALRYE